jgi:hypothetical protein
MQKDHLLIGLLVVGCLATTLGHAMSQETSSYESPHHVSATTCGNCHEDVYTRWKSSMHAHSSPLKDPIYGHFYREIVGDPLEEGVKLNGTYPVCIQCHTPNAAKDQKTKLDAYNYNEGVNCLVCHTLKRYNKDSRQVGLAAYEVSATHLQAPSGRYLLPTEEAYHPFPMEPNQGTLRTSQVCLGCHGQLQNTEAVPLCQTGVEYAEADTSVTCQSCHMPKTQEITDHSMLGGHSETMLARAMVVTLVIEPQADKLKTTVHLQNMLPHSFPTGVPFRKVYMKLTAYDDEDELLWGNFKTYPPVDNDDPQAVFNVVLGDKAGQPTPLGFNATRLLSDSRFKPYEVRDLTYQIPSENVAIIRAEVIYSLLTPELIEKLSDNLTGDLMSPVVAAIAEMRID